MVELADEVLEGATRSFDRTILLWFRVAGDRGEPLGPHRLEQMMRDFTGLSGIGVLTLVTLAAMGYALLLRRSPCSSGRGTGRRRTSWRWPR